MEALKNRKAILLDVDDVMYPAQDYLIQVYYLFANLVEFAEGRPIGLPLATFMKTHYLAKGEEELLSKAQEAFGFSDQFAPQLDRLLHQAQLPLPLMIYPALKNWLMKQVEGDIAIFVYTDQDPALQLNKLKHIEWPALLAKKLQVYFEKELMFRNLDPINYICDQHQLSKSEMLFIGSGKHLPQGILQSGIDEVAINALNLNQ